MPLGAMALPPVAYMDFCRRKPLDCGDDVQLVRAGVKYALAARVELASRIGEANMPPVLVPASIDPAKANGPIGRLAPVSAEPDGSAETATAIATLAAELVSGETGSSAARPLAMTPGLWATLNRVNGEVNGSIRQQNDLKTYGMFDYWNTPLEDGIRVGDCEDFVLEKQRALIKAGLPRSALNIAIVQTAWGELHAVLLVSTTDGEFVLDSLTAGISAWRDAPYRWVRREVNGDPFHWANVDPSAERRDDGPFHRLLIAMGR